MRQGIWAIFLHKISTDENPQHGFCPSGPDTWCRYKKAQLENKVYHHKHKLPVAVVEAIRPIFRYLSDPELLKKCLHGNTQNPNESINNVIWSRVPKKTFVHLETLSFGTYDAIASFNKGNTTKLDILKKLNIEPGYYATCCMEQLDKERITRARYANLQKTKEVRKVKDLKELFKRVNFQKMLKIWNMELECFDKGPVDPKDVIYTKTRLRTPSTDQSLRRPPHPSVMVWDVIAYNVWSPLILISDARIAQWYVHDILQPHVLLLVQWLPGGIFLQDNVRPHTARVSQDCLRTVTTPP
ncbi:uncharacterized protein TNCV_1869281 [Trichonephila clavipes]|nr:uncharacterized protein TNCV_1869281 [Trichonephila clavipes]